MITAKNKVSYTLQALFIIFLTISIYMAKHVIIGLNSNMDIEEKNVHRQADKIRQPLQDQLLAMRQTVQQLLSRNPDLTVTAVKQQLAAVLEQYPLVSGFTVGGNNQSQPEGYSFSSHTPDAVCRSPAEPNQSRNKSCHWRSRIHFTALTNETTLDYQYHPGNNRLIRYVTISVAPGNIIQSFYRGSPNPLYHIILSRDNRIVYHPNPAFINKLSSKLFIFDPLMALISDHNDARPSGPRTSHLFRQATGQSLWLHHQSMDNGNWSIATVFEKELHATTIRNKNRTLLLFVMTTLITLICYSLLILRVEDGEIREYWHLVISFSVISVIAIGVIWTIQLTTAHPKVENEYLLRDETGVFHAVAQNDDHSDLTAPHRPDIPVLAAGVRVDSIDLSGLGMLRIIGLVWLKDPACNGLSGHRQIQQSCLDLNKVQLTFPEAEKVSLRPHSNQSSTRVQRFTLELNFPLDSGIYPFERGNIALRISTADYHHQYRLIPDIAAYGLMNPLTKPGLAEELEFKGWNVYQSYFSYQPWLNTADYGGGDALYDGRSNELYFNIEVGRKFLSPFIADMVPILVIIALLFLILMTMTKDEQHMNELGFNASTMLGYCSGLFFVLIVAHVYLREKLNLDTIAYIEYFYFMMYFMILSISLSAILFSSHFKRSFITHEDGVVVKILFWPSIFIITLIFTFFSFY